MLDVRALSVAFEGTPAVDEVSCAVAKGEVVALLGPSGSGKSTVLRSVAGLQVPDDGSVVIDGTDVRGLAAHERGVGLMFQAPTLFPNRDVAGNVEFGLRMLGVDAVARRRRVGELLELVGLPGFEQRAVATLSGGEAQRVALARTLAPEPRLLLLDEPFGALDAVLRARLVDDVGRLVRSLGLTVLAVTHDREEAYALADRVLVMHDGRVVADGTPEQLWADPGDAWVARFLGMPNVLEAAVRSGRACTAWGEVEIDPDAAGSHVVVPAAAVVVGPAGTHEAVVVGRAFLGDRVRLVLAPPGTGSGARRQAGGELVAIVAVAGAPAIDQAVRVSIGGGRAVVLP